MATKTISISEEAYKALREAKDDKESFTEAIMKLARKDPLSKLAGILSLKEGDDMLRTIRRVREKADKEVRETAERFNDP